MADQQPQPEAAPGGKPAKPPREMLNGEQVTAVLEIVSRVQTGQLLHSSGIAMLVELFRVHPLAAFQILGPEPRQLTVYEIELQKARSDLERQRAYQAAKAEAARGS